MYRSCTKIMALLLPIFLLSSCLEAEFEYYPLYAKVRGLAENETVTISSNGATSQISGTEDLSWSKAQKLRNAPRNDRPDYSVKIIRQPQNSNKACRVLNPTGRAGAANTEIRIECGFPLLVQDADGNMTTDNGLMISNGIQSLALNSSRQLVTSLNHQIIDDPENSEGKVLEVTPVTTMGAVLFSELYLPGDELSLSFSNVNQGCEITSNPLVDGMKYPKANSFSDTVQTIELDKDWIDSKDNFAEGRICDSFSAGTTYLLQYDPEENGTKNKSYTATCFPAPPIEITCNFALKVRVNGINSSDGDFLQINATNRDTGSTHQLLFENNGTNTFNLVINSGDEYLITLDPSTDPATWTTPKTCDFEPNGFNSVPDALAPAPSVSYTNSGSNSTEVLNCSNL